MSDVPPTEQDAVAVVERCLGVGVRRIERFAIGWGNHVYDVVTTDGRCVVVRLNGGWTDFAPAVAWHELLAPRGVPLPRLLGHEARSSGLRFPYMLMERLPGRDLIYEYPDLSSAQKRDLAREIVRIQGIVGELPPGPGFGYAESYEDPPVHAAWVDVLREDLERSRARLRETGVAPVHHVDRVERALTPFAAHFAAVEPRPFLDDITTKNVIVHRGRLSGIVDVDEICFGDPLLTVALTRMSLLKRRLDADYVDCLAAELGLDDERQAVLTVYTALFCVNFLGELGQRFNRDEPVAFDAAEVDYLLGVLDRLLSDL